MSETTVTGLKELHELLQTLPVKVEQNILRGALRAGAVKMRDHAKSLAPVAPANEENHMLYHTRLGSLRDSIRVSVTLKKGKVIAAIKAGGKTKKYGDVYYAHMVEWGTRPHVIRSKDGGPLSIGGGYYYKVDHPGAQAKPFMRPALDTQAAAALIAAGEYMKKRLATKEGLDTQDITIEAVE